MKHKLLPLIIIGVFVILVLMLIPVHYKEDNTYNDQIKNQIVEVNAIQLKIEQEAWREQKEELVQSCEMIKTNLKELTKTPENQTNQIRVYLIGTIAILLLVTCYYYIHLHILKPFHKMKRYTEQIAAGEFEIPLEMSRSQYFGELTWSFDAMRCEIKRARECERQQIENNKTVIATLSHDIKTPIASIRAYAEGLEAGFENSIEKRIKYLNIIIKKCDEVSKLTEDLFLHSLSDMDKLQVNPEETELSAFLEKAVQELTGIKDDIQLIIEQKPVYVCIDPKRMLQILENLVNNARKYAKTKIRIALTISEEEVHIEVKDYGTGIPDADLPFITQKFYRGKNVQNEQGAGLGLYIVSYLMQQMNGQLRLQNETDGLKVILIFS